MKGLKNIYLIVGPSGVGKTSLSEALEARYGFMAVESYTDRPKRSEKESGHIFLTKEEFDRIPRESLVGFVEYNGNRYGVTEDIINEHDLYVIDPVGVQYFIERYKGPKGVVIIGLEASGMERIRRMQSRGDSNEAILERLNVDQDMFNYEVHPILFNVRIKTTTLEDSLDKAYRFIMEMEKSGVHKPLRKYGIVLSRKAYASVEAENEQEALEKATRLEDKQIRWSGEAFVEDVFEEKKKGDQRTE